MVSIKLILPMISAFIMLVFVILVLKRYVKRRDPHYLYWGIGLAMWDISSFAGSYLMLAWNRWVFLVWYLFGAALNAAWIGHGTVSLLYVRQRVRPLTILLVLGSLIACALMIQVIPSLQVSQFTTDVPISEQYRFIMPSATGGATIRLLTPLFNTYGLTTIVGGALWSSYLFWRNREMPNLVIGNILIAAGALVMGSASLLTRLGYASLLYLGEILAASLMFAGFLVNAKPQRVMQIPGSASAPHHQKN